MLATNCSMIIRSSGVKWCWGTTNLTHAIISSTNESVFATLMGCRMPSKWLGVNTGTSSVLSSQLLLVLQIRTLFVPSVLLSTSFTELNPCPSWPHQSKPWNKACQNSTVTRTLCYGQVHAKESHRRLLTSEFQNLNFSSPLATVFTILAPSFNILQMLVSASWSLTARTHSHVLTARGLVLRNKSCCYLITKSQFNNSTFIRYCWRKTSAWWIFSRSQMILAMLTRHWTGSSVSPQKKWIISRVQGVLRTISWKGFSPRTRAWCFTLL